MMRISRATLAGLVTCGVLAGGLMFTAAPALAVAPEAPVTIGPAQSITATTAVLEGTLNPHSTSLVGGYFAYSNPEGSSCMEGPTAGLEEFEGEVDGTALAVHTTVGLQPSSTYKFCLVASHVEGETTEATQGNEVSLTTLAAAPGVEGEGVSGLSSTGATLEAQVNPNNQETTYAFEYSTKATGEVLEGAITTLAGASPLSGFGNQTASVATGVLTPATTYYYRAVAENTAHEKTTGTVASFITQNTPVLTTGTASEITRTSAVLAGQVNPGGLETYYYVQYTSESEYQQNHGEYNHQTPGLPGLSAGLGNSPIVLGSPADPELGTPAYPTITLSELTPSTVYDYRLVATNADGTTYGAPGSFTTLAKTPPIPVTGGASGVSQYSATITGTVNTQGLQTTIWFESGTTPGLGSLEQAQIASTAGANIGIEASFGGSLQPGTTYYYRVRASNQDGTNYGAIQSFTTVPLPAAATFPTTALLSVPASEAPATSKTPVSSTTKTLTRAQKLTQALKACKKKARSKRAACVRKAQKQFGSPKKSKKKKKK